MKKQKRGGGSSPTLKPKAILLSKRANIVLVERARIVQKDGRVLYLTQNGRDVEQFFNVPFRNTSLLLLGKGTSITDSAARQLADSGVIVGFTGSGGSPLTGGIDPVFMSPQGEYRPTEYMQGWMRMWMDEGKRLDLAKRFLRKRHGWTQTFWSENRDLTVRGVTLDPSAIERFDSAISKAKSTEELLGAEAVWARSLYHQLRVGYRVEGFVRQESVQSRALLSDTVNSFLDHGNYIAYGLSAVALYAMGISFALPVLHGKTRRGALVFDVADLFKDATVMPLAFKEACDGQSDQYYRDALVDRMHRYDILDKLMEALQEFALSN
jgi:CRISPR-associated protein Cas1